jgi:hypothetical protein
MQTGPSVVSKAKSFLIRLEEIEEMERSGKAPALVEAHYGRYISDLFDFFKENKLRHEMVKLQEITTRVEETWGVREAEVAQDLQRREEIKALLQVMVFSLEQSSNSNASGVSNLHPFPPILATAAELQSSSQFMTVVGATGVQVDWACADTLSHGGRIRLYQQRFQAAYDDLSPDERLRVSWILAKEVQKINPELGVPLNERLAAVGWKLDGDRLVPATARVSELFFSKGSQHDAYLQIKQIMGKAKRSLRIVDNYVDSELFTLIESLPNRPANIQVLTSHMPTDFALQAKKFMKQHAWAQIEIKRTSDVHDRFIIIDESYCFHLGASIKDAGGKVFMISEIEGEAIRNAVMRQLGTIWQTASV